MASIARARAKAKYCSKSSSSREEAPGRFQIRKPPKAVYILENYASCGGGGEMKSFRFQNYFCFRFILLLRNLTRIAVMSTSLKTV
jgi:hypothetical protein